MNLREQTYLWHVVILRIYIGYYVLQKGIEKFLEGFPQRDWVGRQIGDLEKVDLYPWYESFLAHVVIPNPELFGYLVVYGEILVGLSLIFGLLTRFSSAVGIFIFLNYVLGLGMARGRSSLGMAMTFFVAMIVLFLSNPGRTLGLDGLLFKRKGKGGNP